MADVTIRKIPAHIVYRAEYDVNSLMDFFNPETDENELYDLQLEMEAEYLKIYKDRPMEVTAACYMHQGPFDSFEEGFAVVMDWLKANGYGTEGKGRLSAIHGPWDRDNEADYVNECQIIIKAD